MKPISKETKMNKTEAKYAGELSLRKVGGDILDWRYESLNFRLADNTFYRPDFLIVYADYFEIVEIKGFLRDDALVKFKVAAKEYPWVRWTMLRLKKGIWEVMYQF